MKRWFVRPLPAILRGGLMVVLGHIGMAHGQDLGEWIAEYKADQGDVASVYDLPLSATRLELEERLIAAWDKRLEAVDFDALAPGARIDWHLLRNDLRTRRDEAADERARRRKLEPMTRAIQPVIALIERRPGVPSPPPEETAGTLAHAAEELKVLRKNLQQPHFDDDESARHPVGVLRAASVMDGLGRELDEWFSLHDGFDPEFAWWVRQPSSMLKKELETTASFLRKEIAGFKGTADDPLVGEPIGRDALLAALCSEMIAYSPDELLSIAGKEFEWCEAELQKAARAMDCRDGKEALAKVKSRHAGPGGQPAVGTTEGAKIIRFLKEKDLVTIPPLAEETWKVGMIGAETQKSLPYAVYGRSFMRLAFAHESMSHEDKLMSMRGNNTAFLHIVTPHELIPGHHLQGYMARRHATRRQTFSTPFLVEGWALHWEMLLWDLGYTATPEEKVGALFWRMQRCARVIITLKYHLGLMTPEQMKDFLVDRVGNERAGAVAEVRRYIGDDYGPLYQVAYMIGGLQLRALHKELVGSGKMTHREFHDRILREGPVPVEMIRAALMGVELPRDWKPSWRFADGK